MTGGVKFDEGKLRMDLITPEAMHAMAAVLTMGSTKYGARNWEKGLSRDRVVGALLRHLYAYLSGELIDPESGLSHLAHVLCNAMFLVTLEKRGAFTDE